MEIPSSAAGVVKEMKVKLGDKVSEGIVAAPPRGRRRRRGGTGDGLRSGAGCSAGPGAVDAAAPSPAPRAESAAAGGDVEVVVPDIGDFDEVAVIEVLVKPGDTVAIEQSLITVESDKASMEIPSSTAGVVKALQVKVGDKVSQGSRPRDHREQGGRRRGVQRGGRCRRGDGAGRGSRRRGGGRSAPTPAPAPSAPAPAERQVPTAALPAHEPTAPTGTLPHASPAIRKLARELGVPLDEVKGSGPKGRITQEDVQAFVKAVLAGQTQTRAQGSAKGAAPAPAAGGAMPGILPWPQVDFAKFGPIEQQGPVAHQAHQRPGPASQLGDDSARHQPRRRRHHRPRGVPRSHQQGEREEPASR